MTHAKLDYRQAERVAVPFAGMERECLVFAPARSGKMPLVLMFHGAGDTARGAIIQTGWISKAKKEGFIAAFPEGLRPNPGEKPNFIANPQMWNDSSGRGHACHSGVDDAGFIAALIDVLESRYPVDAERIYIAGFSNGAGVSFKLAALLAGRIAAVAPVCGHCWVSQEDIAGPVPAIYFAGDQDRLNPVKGGTIDLPWGVMHKPPTAEVVSKWAGALGCGKKPAEVEDEGRFIRTLYASPRGLNAEFYVVKGMGHVWPGGRNLLDPKLAGSDPGTLDATSLIWDFFRKQRKVNNGKR